MNVIVGSPDEAKMRKAPPSPLSSPLQSPGMAKLRFHRLMSGVSTDVPDDYEQEDANDFMLDPLSTPLTEKLPSEARAQLESDLAMWAQYPVAGEEYLVQAAVPWLQPLASPLGKWAQEEVDKGFVAKELLAGESVLHCVGVVEEEPELEEVCSIDAEGTIHGDLAESAGLPVGDLRAKVLKRQYKKKHMPSKNPLDGTVVLSVNETKRVSAQLYLENVTEGKRQLELARWKREVRLQRLRERSVSSCLPTLSVDAFGKIYDEYDMKEERSSSHGSAEGLGRWTLWSCFFVDPLPLLSELGQWAQREVRRAEGYMDIDSDATTQDTVRDERPATDVAFQRWAEVSRRQQAGLAAMRALAEEVAEQPLRSEVGIWAQQVVEGSPTCSRPLKLESSLGIWAENKIELEAEKTPADPAGACPLKLESVLGIWAQNEVEGPLSRTPSVTLGSSLGIWAQNQVEGSATSTHPLNLESQLGIWAQNQVEGSATSTLSLNLESTLGIWAENQVEGSATSTRPLNLDSPLGIWAQNQIEFEATQDC
eukprot:TRINITY_DN4635_c0_g1_i3.p1 TRINITY_DN4635_c0_g1~~TRINITY_DN4635_c0_g1_i3.p1  ORF type:complete len:538 (+),score=138.03 TRINITY_DN4635_c0_g1_i3:119-1732(+)